ncbi:DUF779 domain-containing protein [Brevibacterium ravenspurgense]|uniref:DUF779 domain-containing protein n=1 Tax=Brevibacterium ravenspurgense TaxID=479117 RepID=UPI0002FE8911|nr:DUF779 domain-containing protein [Brevibacterium ravenspurgense]
MADDITGDQDGTTVTAQIEARPEIDGEQRSRVGLSPAAVELLQKLIQQHGQLMFHQSGGCCDGSAPMCYPEGEFLTGDSDVLLGTFTLPDVSAESAEIGFWMSKEQFEYWKHTYLLVDAVPGRGGGFSLESPTGLRFLIRSRLLD